MMSQRPVLPLYEQGSAVLLYKLRLRFQSLMHEDCG